MQLVQAMESAEDTKHLQRTQGAPEVHHNTSRPDTSQRRSLQQDKASKVLSCVTDAEITNMQSVGTRTLRCVQKKGDIVTVCRSRVSRRRPSTTRTHFVGPGPPRWCVLLFALKSEACVPIIKNMTINGVSVEMELDIGAAYTVITQMTYQKIAQQKNINSLKYSDLIAVVNPSVKVSYGHQECES